MLPERIQVMLEMCSKESRNFPPTVLYNESWLLRLVLDWFSRNQIPNYPLNFQENAHWFSEAALPSHFLKNPRGTRLAEGWSHADGVIGYFEVGKGHKIDLSFRPEGTQFVVLEAKMFSPLAPKVSNIQHYDQAARIVACMAETLCRARCNPSELQEIGFYLLAPESMVDKGIFDITMSFESINKKVEQRVIDYESADPVASEWYVKYFQNTLRKLDLRILKWEDVIKEIDKYDFVSADYITEFYNRCLYFGKNSSG